MNAGRFPHPSLTTRSQRLRDGTFGVVAGREDSPDKRFPAGKQAAGQGSRGVRCLGLRSIQSQGEPKKACSTGRTRLKRFICGEEQPRERGRRQTRTTPGSPDTGARGPASQTVENIPEHLSCLEVLSVLLIACSHHLLFEVFHPHSLFATRCSLIALAQKGRRLLAEKESRSSSCST